MGQSNKPGNISWATDVAAQIVDPPAGKKLVGWLGLDIPPNGWVNWFWNLTSDWINYFQGLLVDGSDSWIISGMQLEPLAVPDANSVRVLAGTAIANSTLVEVTGAEVIAMPAAQGTAPGGLVTGYRVKIDDAGALSVDTIGTFASRELIQARVRVGGVDDVGVAETTIGLVFNESTLATYDFSSIGSDDFSGRQILPISNRIVAPNSLYQSRLGDPSVRLELLTGSQDNTDPKDVRIPLRLRGMATGTIQGAILAAGLLVDSIQLTIKVHRLEADDLGARGSSGRTHRLVHPFSNSSYTRMPGLSIEKNSVLVPDLNGDDGAVNFWTGLVNIKPDTDLELILGRQSGDLAFDYYIEIATNHGATHTVLVSLPVVP